MEKITAYLEENRQRNQDDLFELLRMASVSTDSQYESEVRRAGEWVADQFRGLGFDTCLLYTSPSPRDATLSRMPSSA